MHSHMHVIFLTQVQRADRHTLKHIHGSQHMNPYYGEVNFKKTIFYFQKCIIWVPCCFLELYVGYQIVKYKVIGKYSTPKEKNPNKE